MKTNEKSIWGIVEISSELIDEKDLLNRMIKVKEEPMVPAKLGRKTIEAKLAFQAAVNSAEYLLDAITNGVETKGNQQLACLNILWNLKRVSEDMRKQGLWVDDFVPSCQVFLNKEEQK